MIWCAKVQATVNDLQCECFCAHNLYYKPETDCPRDENNLTFRRVETVAVVAARKVTIDGVTVEGPEA